MKTKAATIAISVLVAVFSGCDCETKYECEKRAKSVRRECYTACDEHGKADAFNVCVEKCAERKGVEIDCRGKLGG